MLFCWNPSTTPLSVVTSRPSAAAFALEAWHASHSTDEKPAHAIADVFRERNVGSNVLAEIMISSFF
jgi:hypothetical protein